MKDQSGSIAVILLAILALLAIGGAYYEVRQRQASQSDEVVIPPKVQQEVASQQPNTSVGAAPDPTFAATPTSGTAPLSVVFAFHQDVSPNRYSIAFGDGDGMWMQSATTTHTYTAAGQYTAALCVDPWGYPAGVGPGSPEPGCYSGSHYKTILITVGTTGQDISVPGMSKYTDSDFGFSFWYPSGWVVTKHESISHPDQYPGGEVVGVLTVSKGSESIEVAILEVNSSTGMITDLNNSVTGNTPDNSTFWFDENARTWMKKYGDEATTTADTSDNSMGGLHIFWAGQRFSDDSVLPLSAKHFLVVNDSTRGYQSHQEFEKTIVATDPSVATPVSAAEQIKAIQAENDAYAGQ